jgi:hypothetical protein
LVPDYRSLSPTKNRPSNSSYTNLNPPFYFYNCIATIAITVVEILLIPAYSVQLVSNFVKMDVLKSILPEAKGVLPYYMIIVRATPPTPKNQIRC